MKFMLPPSQLPRLKPGSYVSYDVESSGLYPDDGHFVTVVSVAWLTEDVIDPDPIVVSSGRIAHAAFAFDQGHENKPWYTGPIAMFGGAPNLPVAEWHALHRWLFDNRVRLTAHNLQYDAIMAGAGLRPEEFGECGYDLLPLWKHDSMLAAHWLFPAKGAGLKPTFERESGERGSRDAEEAKDKWLRRNKSKFVKQGYPFTGKDDKGYDLVPWEIMGPYASEDARQCLWLTLYELDLFETSEWYGYYLQDVEMAKQAVREERRGLPFDADAAKSQIPPIRQRMWKLGQKLPFSPMPDNAKKYFFGVGGDTDRGVQTLGLGAPRTTEAGKPSLDALTVSEFARDDVPFAAEWRDYSLLKRVGSMYYSGWGNRVGKDGHLRARLRTKGTVSGRFSIERVNLQAMPQDGKMDADEGGVLEGLLTPRQLIRQAVETKYPDFVLVEGDMSQAELRLGAWRAGCDTMLDAYAEGKDMHTLTAELIGAPRKPGKVANLSLEYGTGIATFDEMLKKWGLYLPIDEVKEIHGGWNRAYPEFKRAYYRWESIGRKLGYVPFTNGVRRYFKPWESFHSSWNQHVQGSLAQYMIRWILAAENVCSEYDLPPYAGILLQVHDSQIALLPRDVAPEIMGRIKAEGLAIWEDEFPGLPGDIDWQEFAGDPLDVPTWVG